MQKNYGTIKKYDVIWKKTIVKKSLLYYVLLGIRLYYVHLR